MSCVRVSVCDIIQIWVKISASSILKSPGRFSGKQAGRQAGKQAGKQAGREAGVCIGTPLKSRFVDPKIDFLANIFKHLWKRNFISQGRPQEPWGPSPGHLAKNPLNIIQLLYGSLNPWILEVQMYSSVFVDMSNFVKSRGVMPSDYHESEIVDIPKCFYAHWSGEEGEGKEDMIIMENLIPKGFAFIVGATINNDKVGVINFTFNFV